MYPTYVRGLAYRQLHLADPIGPAARLQLARALRDAGETAGSKAAYRDFLVLWKDADPDIPLLQQAKAEFALL